MKTNKSEAKKFLFLFIYLHIYVKYLNVSGKIWKNFQQLDENN